MTISNGILTIERVFDDRATPRKYLFSLENSTVAAPPAFDGSFAPLFPSAYQVVQTDRGLTLGGTMYPQGSSPPAITPTGTWTGAVVPIRVECTLLGARGTWQGRVSYDEGATWPQTFTSAAAVALTGAGTGITLNIATGNAATNNVWLATCSGLADQSGNGKHYVGLGSDPAQWPVITLGVNGVACIANPPSLLGLRLLDSSLVLPATTTPTMCLAVYRALGWTAGRRLVGNKTFDNHLAILQLDGSSPDLEIYGAAAGSRSSALAINAWGVCEAKWGNSTADYIRLGAASAVTGTNTGSIGPGTGRQIFAAGDGNYGAFELAALIYTPPVDTTAFRAAVATKYAGLVAA